MFIVNYILMNTNMKQYYLILLIALSIQGVLAGQYIRNGESGNSEQPYRNSSYHPLNESYVHRTDIRADKSTQMRVESSIQSYTINGVKYNITSASAKTVEVTFPSEVLGEIRYTGDIVIPEKISIESEEYTVISIAPRAFDYCRDLTSVTLPNSITSIGYAAFYWCDKLLTINLPTSLKYIGVAAFEKCKGFTIITIPEKVEKIDEWAFYDNSNLMTIDVPASVTTIGEGAFSYCPMLTGISVHANNTNFSSVEGVLYNANKSVLICYPNSKSNTFIIPQTVISIGNFAFAGCDKLTAVLLPVNIKTIGNSSFEVCSNLSTINLPNSLISIGEYAFSKCTSLITMNWPSSVPIIKKGMFWLSTNLLTFDLPSTVTKIESFAFSNTKSLNAITVNPNNLFYSSLDGVLFNKNKTILITFPLSKSDTYIVPQSVDSIGGDGFRYCKNLSSITLTSSIRSIANVAFDSCVNLKMITIERNVPPTAFINTFRGVNKLTCVIKVPTSFVSAYQAAPYWSEFQQITDVINTAIPKVNNSNLKIHTLQNSIIIEGFELNEMVLVFSTSGKMLHNIQAKGDKIVIPVTQGQVYFIKTKEGGRKVSI